MRLLQRRLAALLLPTEARVKPYSWWGTYYAFMPRALYESHVAFLHAFLEVRWPSWEELAPGDRARWQSLVTCIGIKSGSRGTGRMVLSWMQTFALVDDAPRVTFEDAQRAFDDLTWSEQHVLRFLNAQYNALGDAFHNIGLPYTHDLLPGYVDPRPEAK